MGTPTPPDEPEVVLLPGTTARLVARTLRVPAVDGPPGDATILVRQLDAALLSEGFVAPARLLAHLAGLDPDAVRPWVHEILGAVRRRIGSGPHTPYFVDFPAGVPPTEHFWAQCLAAAELLVAPWDRPVTGPGAIDLTTLPHYGRYQHSFAEMLARREPRVASALDRRTRLELGGTVAEEAVRAFRELATATTPPTEPDLALLADLAAAFLVATFLVAPADPAAPGVDRTALDPADVPVRENRAVIDSARMAAGRPLALAGTVTDVLRVAVRASGGDVSLARPARLRSFARRERRVLLDALERIVAAQPSALVDVAARRERWKRLGERLHPHEHAARRPHAARVFAVARGEVVVRSAAGRAELALTRGDAAGAAAALAVTPGVLLRWCDRLLRHAGPDEVGPVLAEVDRAAAAVSGRLLCSLRRHLENVDRPDGPRLFVNRRGRAHLAAETREPLDADVVARLTALVDAAIGRRLPDPGILVLGPGIESVAVPVSGKESADGHAVLPRGSTTPLDPTARVLRFFVHWRQVARRTDYDLSVLLLDEDFCAVDQVSWTNLRGRGMVHSGDLTDATDGATEFVDVRLDEVRAAHVVPQVNLYAGEAFAEAAESIFGYMTLDALATDHRTGGPPPFEPRAVRARSELRGDGRVALPLIFSRAPDGTWAATWAQLHLTGWPRMNRVETNHATTSTLLREVAGMRPLTVGYLAGLLGARSERVVRLDEGAGADLADVGGPVTYVGRETVDGLPPQATVITLDRLSALVPP